MAQEEYDIIFNVKGLDQGVSSVNELADAMENVDEQAKKTEDGVKKVGEAAKDAGEKGKDAGEATEGAFKVADEATGGLATKIKEVGKGLLTMGKTGYQALLKLAGGSKAFAVALASTGIGLLVVALGAISAYWDDIIGVVSGVGSEQKKLLEDANATAEAAQEQLGALEASENTLKLQGKSEKEIRDLKIQQTEEAISALQVALEQQKQVKKAQVEASERNAAILKGILMFISAPITLILATIDKISAFIGEGTNLVDDVFGSVANMVFDPEEVAAEGDATIAETEKTIATLQNKRDGYLLQEKEGNKKAATERIDNEKSLNAELAKLRAENLADAEAKALALLELQRETERQALVDKKASAELLAEFDKQTEIQRNAIINQYAEERAAKQKELDDKYLANRQTINDLLRQADLDAIEDQFERARQELEIQANTDLEKMRMAGATEEEINRIKKSYVDKANKLAEEEAQFKEDLRQADIAAALSASSDILGGIINLVGEGSAVGKAAAVSQTVIDTYASATGAYKSVVGIPVVGPALAPIAAGVAVATGLANIKKIMSTKVPGDKPVSTSGMPSVPAAATFDPTAALAASSQGQTQSNQITLGNQTGSTGANVVKAYVVSSEMSSQQEADRKITDLARL